MGHHVNSQAMEVSDLSRANATTNSWTSDSSAVNDWRERTDDRSI